MNPNDTQPVLAPTKRWVQTQHHSARHSFRLKLGWLHLRLLSLLLLSLSQAVISKAADVPSQDGERQAKSDTPAAPSLELLLFLADWNDGEDWLDPVALERVMRESSDQDETEEHLLSSESGVEEHDDH